MNQENLSYELDEPLEAVGAATSDWQSNPLLHDGTDSRSDWGRELVRKNEGHKNGIHGSSHPDELPRFDRDYRKIIDRVDEMNGDTFRMSLDFGRLCPEKGVFDESLMAHYVRVLAYCKRKGLEPMITLHHWTAPASFSTYKKNGDIKNGPLEHPEIVEHFNFYVNKVADFLCNPEKIRKALEGEGYDKGYLDYFCDEKMLASWFITINEPTNLLFSPYLVGAFPPYQFASFRKFPKLLKKVKAMHDQSYDILHEKAEKAMVWTPKVGIAHVTNHMNRAIPFYEDYSNVGLAEKMEEGSQSDFMGIQYYFRVRLGMAGLMPVISGSDPRYRGDHPQFGQIYPPGIYDVLKYVGNRYPGKELMVTEFGFADRTDRKRPSWIIDTVGHMLRAKQEGVKITGALIWSAINNFEWAEGMSVPFGIHEKNGENLQSDDGTAISSKTVWSNLSRHLRGNLPETALKMQKLQQRAREQLNNSTAIQKV